MDRDPVRGRIGGFPEVPGGRGPRSALSAPRAAEAVARAAAILPAAAIALLLLVAAAGAHATLIGSEPADGAVVAEAPPSITLRFSESVRPLVARLTYPGGRTEVLQDIGGERAALVALALPAGLTEGTHILSWRVVSSDGHPIGGGLVFSVGVPSAVEAAPAVQPDPVVRAGLWAGRLALMLGLVAGVGGAVFLAAAGGAAGAARRVVTGALWLGLAAAPVLIGFQGLDVLGAPVAALAGREAWSAGLWSTSYGPATLTAATALLLAGGTVGAGADRRLAAAFATVALLLAGLAVAAAGHASGAPPRLITGPAVFVHAAAAALWIGALVPLLVALRRGGRASSDGLRRFSVAAPFIVLGLLVSGLALTVAQVQSFAALWTTDYGRILIVKLALVAAILGFAAINRFRLTAPALAGDPRARRGLARSIGAEIVLALAVIAVLGLWRFTPPPRAIAADPARFEAQEVEAAQEDVRARLSIHPPIAGPVRVEVADLRLDGEPFEPASLTIELDKPSYGLGPFEREARRMGADRYVAEGFVLPLDGFWVVRARILVTEFRSVTLTEIFDVRKAPR